MESIDLESIEENITEWWALNCQKIDRFSLEFCEIIKNLEEGTFVLNFKKKASPWMLKYNHSFWLEADQEQGLANQINQLISQQKTNPINILQLYLKVLDDLTYQQDLNSIIGDADMEPDCEGEDQDGWSDEEDAAIEVRNDQEENVKDHISKYNARLASKEGIKLFRQSKITKSAIEMQQLIDKNLSKDDCYLSLQIFEPLMIIKVTIDLNFQQLSPTVYESIGFEMHELVEYLLIFEDNKLLMFRDDPSLPTKDLQELLNLGILKIEFCQLENNYLQERYKAYLQILHESYFNMKDDEVITAPETKPIHISESDKIRKELLQIGFSSAQANSVSKITNNIDEAVNYLLDENPLPEETKEDHKEDIMVEDGRMVECDDPKYKLFSSITTEDLKKNPVLSYFKHVLFSLDSIPDYCCICRDKLSTKANTIRCCNKELCEFSFEESQGVAIMPEIKKDPEVFALNLSIFSECLMSERVHKIFEPFPSFFLKDKELRTKRGYLDNVIKARIEGGQAHDVNEINKDIDKIRRLFKRVPSIQKCISKCSDDEVLLSILEKEVKNTEDSILIYKLLQYLTTTSRVSVKKLKDSHKCSGSSKIEEYILYNNEVHDENLFQSRKSELGSLWSFHGSQIENWYSILRNGPRNLSATKMMNNGKTHGEGIYSTKEIDLALVYSNKPKKDSYCVSTIPQSWKHSTCKEKVIIGVFEIISEKNITIKTVSNRDYIICPNDECIKLRYIWIIASNCTEIPNKRRLSEQLNFSVKYYSTVKDIQEELLNNRKLRLKASYERAKARYHEEMVMRDKLQAQLDERDKLEQDKQYDDKIQKLEASFTGKGSVIATKRILKEYKHFQTSTDIENFEIKFKGDNFYQWSVVLDILKFELTPELKEDFQWVRDKSGINPTLQFEVIFPASFPFDPPFIRVVQPIFKFRTGHVTIGGSLCMESLTPSAWSSARSIEGIFIEILSIILQGEARLDKKRLGRSYSIQEAKLAFERVAKHHGWL
ncbi:unnamed protein product [Moneuplotes crassus]|uniref:UBC core domain-containing protein n=1 Tax=Euplotes crassus TaxID=5936 RepID=A0AAD1XUK7_EUPCR|nr:unnamed protein product [Moneuplotes crassus]